MLIEHLIVALLVICIYYLKKIDSKTIRRKRPRKKEPTKLGDLTGRYKHFKKPGGNQCLVEFKLKGSDGHGYRIATKEDLVALDASGYLKKS